MNMKYKFLMKCCIIMLLFSPIQVSACDSINITSDYFSDFGEINELKTHYVKSTYDKWFISSAIRFTIYCENYQKGDKIVLIGKHNNKAVDEVSLQLMYDNITKQSLERPKELYYNHPPYLFGYSSVGWEIPITNYTQTTIFFYRITTNKLNQLNTSKTKDSWYIYYDDELIDTITPEIQIVFDEELNQTVQVTGNVDEGSYNMNHKIIGMILIMLYLFIGFLLGRECFKKNKR